MGVLINNDIVTVRFYSYLLDQLAINVLHYRTTSVVSNPTTAHFASLLATTMPGLYKPLMSTQATYLGVAVQKTFPLPNHTPNVDVTGAAAGTSGAVPLPRQDCGIVTKRTAFAGRQYRGRVYLPFPSTADNEATEGTPNAAYLTAANAWAASALGNWTINTGGNQATMVPILWHADTGTYTDLAGFSVRDRWATQRRRGSYGRTNDLPFA